MRDRRHVIASRSARNHTIIFNRPQIRRQNFTSDYYKLISFCVYREHNFSYLIHTRDYNFSYFIFRRSKIIDCEGKKEEKELKITVIPYLMRLFAARKERFHTLLYS